MLKNYFLFIVLLSGIQAYTQNTYDDIYQIFQDKCMACHNNATKTANLDLEGSGATVQAKMADVYANLYKQNPSNTTATAANNFLIFPGDPYRSFLYRKIDNNLTPGLMLHAGEGITEPNGETPLADKEIELIRQWILYGANETGTFFDKTLLEDYYDNGGVASIENPPVPPAEGEGFQIHLGPFFLEPGGEKEYFSKYEPLFDNDLEVYKLSTTMGEFSHHFIVYKFSNTFGNVDPNLVPYGMRPGQDFDGREFISVDQYSNALNLPEGSAFLWEQNTVFDLNTHYINYSSTQVLKCEVYYNVYTQDVGTANQEMEVILVPHTNIPIPNDNIPITFTDDFALGTDLELYVWGLTAHTHQYGRDFNIYRNNLDGSRGEQLYDAGCVDGIPGCGLEDFDYSHLPIKFNYPFVPVNLLYGVEAEATYQNDGPVSVDWGFTSDDEMMIFVAFYVADTTGVAMQETIEEPTEPIPNAIQNNEIETFKVYPNPSSASLNFEFKDLNKTYEIIILDVSGREIKNTQGKGKISIDIVDETNGIYFYQIKSNGLSIANGKFAKD